MAVLRRLANRWVLSLLGTLLLCVLLWLLGPLLTVLAPVLPRAAIAVVLLLVWAGANLLLDRRGRRRDAALADGVVAGHADAIATEAREEQAAIGEKLARALDLLRRARGTRGYLYEQPWYVIIGPPGAGKTTALLNAGLQFPLAETLGQGAVAGVGGTRLCDWWFTDDAVLIDTAGRYTLQDSNAAVDRAGWEGFLALLKRARPRQPLNGVLVAIAVSDVAQGSAAERAAHARAIRARLRELETTLGLRLPVYAVFTKADLLAGFTEFFDDLDRERRGQVWGATFDAKAAGEVGPVTGFAAELAALVERLEARLVDRLQAERSPERRARIAGFPAQVATLAEPLGAFLTEAFGGSRLDPAPFLRGFYLASGTQDGTPIDRLTGAMARSFGVDQQRLPSLRPERGRSYFLHRLLAGVVFGEAMLASERPGAARRRRLVRAGTFGAMAAVAIASIVAILAGHAQAGRQVDATAEALDAYEKSAGGIPLDPVSDADLPTLAPLLDQAHALAAAVPPGGLLLSQSGKLRAGADAVYRHALTNALLPRLLWRLETQMRGNLTEPDFLYEATRVYLMLGSQGPLDRSLVRQWMLLDWRSTYPGAFNAPLIADLQTHLDALLALPLPSAPLDGTLIAQARQTFSRVSLASRVYSRIKPSAAAERLPPWRPGDALGPAGTGVFVRASGKALSDGIPGFFTVEGFHGVLIPALPGAAREVASESWVLGKDASADAAALPTLEHDVVALYEADYEQAWDAVLADLDIMPLHSLGEAAQDLYILASPQSPMKDLLVAVAHQLTLSKVPVGTGGLAAREAAAASAVTSEASRLSSLFGAGAASAATIPLGGEVDARYAALRNLVARDNGAGIDQALKALNDLQQEMAKLAAAPIGAPAAAPIGADPTLALRAQAQTEPQPLARWMLAAADQGATLRGGGARQQVAATYNGASGPASLCQQAVNGRFPFTPASTIEIPLDDFAKLFAPGALLDGFFNTQLRPYVDTTGKEWKPQPANGVPPPVSADDVAQFQRAATIRDLFFAAGSSTPGVKFDVTPMSLDAGSNQVSFAVGAASIDYSHGPPRATQVSWPGATGMQNVRLVFDPPPAGGTGVISESGPWALFRMLNHGTLVQAGSSDRYQLGFKLGDREAAFALRAGSVLNPLAPGLLAGFHCPVVQ